MAYLLAKVKRFLRTWFPSSRMFSNTAYMPKDVKGYQYFLTIGDIFSKYIQAVPLRDQTAPTIIKALSNSWIYVHGSPLYLLSDQGSNVDGEVMRELCNTLFIDICLLAMIYSLAIEA